MFSRRTIFLITLMLAVTFYISPRYEAEAMDPVTMAILMPIAIQAAKVMTPYIVKAVVNMTVAFAKASVHLLEMLLLPVGLIEVTLLCFWLFKPGIRHLIVGFCAPFKFAWKMLLLPLAPFGVGVNTGGR